MWKWIAAFVLAVCSGVTLNGNALAHPVAYQGSLGFMGYLSKGMTDLELNYSVKYWLAPSVQALRFTEGVQRPDYLLGKLNVLAYRLNGEAHQANLYFHGGGGHSRISQGGVFHGGVTADFETRRIYFLTQWDYIGKSRREATFWKARAGFAPYLSGFDSLHSWLILEANRKSLGDGRVNFVPTLRFFYQNVLWEIGSSLSGEMHLNYIIHI